MKSSDKNRAVLAEAVARSWKDTAFRASLKADPKGVLKAGGMDIPAETEVVVLENTPTILYAVLPPKEEHGKYKAQIDKAVSRISELPDDVELRVVRDSAKKAHVVLPLLPASVAVGALSDDQLEQVAGGKSNVSTNTNVQTNAEAQAEAVQTTVEATTTATTAEVAAEVAAVVVPCFIS